jgi:hypothetical protein
LTAHRTAARILADLAAVFLLVPEKSARVLQRQIQPGFKKAQASQKETSECAIRSATPSFRLKRRVPGCEEF